MPSTTHYKRGDVVLVPFPFTDLRAAKQRPALVISPDPFNSSHDDLLVAAITSQIPAALSGDEVLIPPTDLTACGLPKPSISKTLKLVTLHRLLVVRCIGSLPEPARAQVSARLHEQL